MIFFRRRYYDSSLGRFLTPDPEGFTKGMNLYSFVLNDPLRRVDLFGLYSFYTYGMNEDFYSQRESLVNFTQNLFANPRVQGTMQAIGGLAEAGIGAGLALGSEGLGAPLGWGIMAHGIDEFSAGMHQVFTGQPSTTLTEGLLQKVGFSQGASSFANSALGAIGTFGGFKGISAGQKLFSQKFNLPPDPLKSLTATSMINTKLLNNRLLAEEIAGGHAFEKHVIKQNQFPGFSKGQFEQHIFNILNNPTEMKYLKRGRVAYWHQETETVVIKDPLRRDGGTAFRPLKGYKYYLEDIE